VPVAVLLNKKATWGFFIATFLTDPVWWFYLFWLPSYLTSNGMTKTEIAFPLTVVYAVTAMLSIAGGWLSSFFYKNGLVDKPQPQNNDAGGSVHGFAGYADPVQR
jgi:ACS family hexuronate transporter-like MFS transporter